MKRLGTLPCAGTSYAVVEGNTHEFPQLEGVYGFCEQSAQRLLLLEGMSANRFRRTLNHEHLHALIEEAGAACFFRGDTEEERAKAQEDFIRVLEPHWTASMAPLLRLGGRHG